MEFFDLVNISEKYMELINPTTPEKMVTIGKYLRLSEGSRVLDFGCGFGEALVLWAEQYGAGGIGIDVRPYACERAGKKVDDRGLAERIEIVCGKGADYRFEPRTFDAATCIGASFVWGGYREAVGAMKDAVRSGGRLAVGEPYWRTDCVPPEYTRKEQSIHTESDLLEITREEGFDLEYVVRGSDDDWDRYEAENWHGLVRWIEENPEHAERREVIDHLHKSQDEYLRYGRKYLGWAVYVLAPKSY